VPGVHQVPGVHMNGPESIPKVIIMSDNSTIMVL
jgi:hypothetical protein